MYGSVGFCGFQFDGKSQKQVQCQLCALSKEWIAVDALVRPNSSSSRIKVILGLQMLPLSVRRILGPVVVLHVTSILRNEEAEIERATHENCEQDDDTQAIQSNTHRKPCKEW